MIKLNNMEKLLSGVRVEWKRLDQLAIIGTGNRNTNEAVEDGKYPFFVRSQIPRRINEFEYDETAIITAGDGVGVGKVFHFIKGKYGLHQRAYRIVVIDDKIVNPKFLYYFFQNDFYSYVTKNSVHASVTSLRKPMFEKYMIPIPQIDIQNNIVRILDKLTILTAELISEINVEFKDRKKQYEYYRDMLFRFEDNEVEWKQVNEIGEIVRGNGMQKKDFVEEGFPAIHYGQIHTQYGTFTDKTLSFVTEHVAEKLKIARMNDLLIATTSENDEDLLKSVAWLGEKTAISGDMMLLKHSQNAKYLAYYFQTTSIMEQKRKYITGTKVRRISKDNLGKLLVPIPKDRNKQEQIVSILDKYEVLSKSVSDKLAYEIELRQKQYEYYQDVLLSFPNSEVEV